MPALQERVGRHAGTATSVSYGPNVIPDFHHRLLALPNCLGLREDVCEGVLMETWGRKYEKWISPDEVEECPDEKCVDGYLEAFDGTGYTLVKCDDPSHTPPWERQQMAAEHHRDMMEDR